MLKSQEESGVVSYFCVSHSSLDFQMFIALNATIFVETTLASVAYLFSSAFHFLKPSRMHQNVFPK